MEQNKKIKINIHMFIFLSITLVAIFTDLLCYFVKTEYNIALLISSIITLFLIWYSRKKIFNIKSDFDKFDIIPIIIIFFLSIFKLSMIDEFIDTITYHLTSQQNPFLDNITTDFFPSSVFFFPLGDRINYIFVHFLGNRFGTLLTCYAILVAYYQVKNALSLLIPNLSKIKKMIFLILFISSNTIIKYPGTYFIDNYSAIFAFELIYLFIQNVNLLDNKKYLYLSAFISGCLIGIKTSNAFLAIPIILLLLIRNIKDSGFKILKNIKIFDYLFLIIITLLPFIVYFIRGYIETGNPVFPLMNNIFHSPYLKDINGLDTRLGPKSILEFIFWPIIICINMVKGDDIHAVIENTWGVGYILLIYTLCTYKKHSKDFNCFAILTFLINIVWTKFLFGYTRYGLALSFCYYIVVFYYLNNVEFSLSKIPPTIKDTLIYILKLILIIVLFIYFSIMNFAFYHYYFYSILEYNIPYKIENDKKITKPYNIENGVWLCTRYNNYYTSLIKDKSDSMYNLDIITPIDPMCKSESKYSEYAQNLFYEKIKNKDLYIAIPHSYSSYVYDLLEINNLEIIEDIGIYSDTNFMNPYNYVSIVKVKFIN